MYSLMNYMLLQTVDQKIASTPTVSVCCYVFSRPSSVYYNQRIKPLAADNYAILRSLPVKRLQK